MRQRIEFTPGEVQAIIAGHINECSLMEVNPKHVEFMQDNSGNFAVIVDTDGADND